MTVAELIQKLTKCDQALDVAVYITALDFRPIVHIEECMVGADDNEKPALVLWWSVD